MDNELSPDIKKDPRCANCHHWLSQHSSGIVFEDGSGPDGYCNNLGFCEFGCKKFVGAKDERDPRINAATHLLNNLGLSRKASLAEDADRILPLIPENWREAFKKLVEIEKTTGDQDAATELFAKQYGDEDAGELYFHIGNAYMGEAFPTPEGVEPSAPKVFNSKERLSDEEVSSEIPGGKAVDQRTKPTPPESIDARIDELLEKQSTDGLSEEEEQQLANLLRTSQRIRNGLSRKAANHKVVEFSHQWTNEKPVQVTLVEEEGGLYLDSVMIMGDRGYFEWVDKDAALFGRLEKLVEMSDSHDIEDFATKMSAEIVEDADDKPLLREFNLTEEDEKQISKGLDEILVQKEADEKPDLPLQVKEPTGNLNEDLRNYLEWVEATTGIAPNTNLLYNYMDGKGYAGEEVQEALQKDHGITAEIPDNFKKDFVPSYGKKFDDAGNQIDD